MIQYGLAGQRETQSESVRFAGGYEWVEYPFTNLIRNSWSRIFYFNHRVGARLPGADADLSAAWHRLEGIDDQIKKRALDSSASERHLDAAGNIERDANAAIFSRRGGCFRGGRDDLAYVTEFGG